MIALFLAAATLVPALGASAATDFPVRVIFEFRDANARAQYKDAEIPAKELDISQKLRQACAARLTYWTFVPGAVADLTDTPKSPKNPVLRIWLEQNPTLGDVRLQMQLQGPTMQPVETLPWSATLFEPGELDRLKDVPLDEVLPRKIFDKFEFSDHDAETLLRKNEADIRNRLQTYVPIARGDDYKYLGPTPLQKPKDAVAMLPLARKECRELVRSEFLVRYLRGGNSSEEVAALVKGQAIDSAGVRVVLSRWKEQPDKDEPVEDGALPPARLKEIFDTFTGLRCRLIYLSKFQPFDVLE